MIAMYITFCIFGFLLLLVCIESFIQQKKREEDDLCEKAERAIAQLQRLRKDTLKKAEIYFYLPEDNLWRVALQTAITMTEDTLHAVHETLGRATEKKRKRIYKSAIATCEQSERALRDTFSSIEAFLVDSGPSRHALSKDGKLIESPN